MNFLFISYYLLFAVLGLCVGSFINMAIYRVRHNKNFFGFSFCDYCKKPLAINALIPLFSFIAYKGKSKCCNKPLDKNMPLVEFITALAFMVLCFLYLNNYFLKYISTISLMYWVLIASILIFLFFYDLLYFELPLIPVILGYFLWAIYEAVKYFWLANSYSHYLLNYGLGEYLIKTNYVVNQLQFYKQDLLYTGLFAVFVTIFFLFLWGVTRGRGMGSGDVYFAPLLALIIGFPASPIYLALSFIVGALFGILLIIFKGKNLKTAVPFGPFLIIGFLMALTFTKLFYTF